MKGVVTTVPKKRVGEEIKALTGVRAFAALWVLSLHYNQAFPVAPLDGWFAFVCRGHIGVDIFFVLSGYILAYVYYDRLRFFSPQDCKIFLFLRLARIYPAYLVGLLATVGLFVVATMIFSYEFNAPGNWRLSHLPFQITLTQAWGFDEISLWNVPSWSVSSEWLAYLTMPLLLPMVLRGRELLWLVMVVLLVTAIVVVYGYSGLDVATSFKGWRAVFRVLSEFWLGVLLFALIGRSSFSSALGEAAVIVALGGFFLLPYFAFGDIWLLLLCPLLITGLHKANGVASRIFSSTPMVYVGKASYSVYIMHFPVQLVLVQLYARLGVFGSGPMGKSIGLVVAVGTALFAGVLLFHFVETPCRRALQERVASVSI